PLTRTSISFTPNFNALSAHVSAARCAANGVLFRLPLKPDVPAVAQQSTSPLVSVMVTVVLLNVALMCATARATLRRIFFRTALLTNKLLKRHESKRMTPEPTAVHRSPGDRSIRVGGTWQSRATGGCSSSHFFDALLASDRLPNALPRSSVGARSLAAH